MKTIERIITLAFFFCSMYSIFYELYVMEVEWVIELKNVSKIYKRNNEETVALNNVNLHIEKGEIGRAHV